MRLCPLLLALMAVPLSPGFGDAAATGIHWRESVQAAASEAKDTARPLLIKFSTSWCGYCRRMQTETFADAQVIHHVEDCFVPVNVDGDVSRGLVQQYGVRSYPTTLIISPEMKVLAKITGFRTPDQLSGDLTKICEHKQDHNADPQRPRRKVLRKSVFGRNCPVCLVGEGSMTLGNSEIFTDYRGFRITFKSDSHRAKFLLQPESYWPVADGSCVVSALDQGKSQFGSFDQGLKYRGRIWLFADAAHRKRFRQLPHEYLDRLVQRMEANASVTRETDASGPAVEQLTSRVGSPADVK